MRGMLLRLLVLPLLPHSGTHGASSLLPTIRNRISRDPRLPRKRWRLCSYHPASKATVFAAEPDVQNPIAMAWDSRGRLWVAENYTYGDSSKKYDLTLRDRIKVCV